MASRRVRAQITKVDMGMSPDGTRLVDFAWTHIIIDPLACHFTKEENTRNSSGAGFLKIPFLDGIAPVEHYHQHH